MSSGFNHGVAYKPGGQNTQPSYNLNDAEGAGFQFVRIYWIDLANIRRCRVLSLSYFKELVKSSRPGVNIAKITLGLIYLMAPPISVAFSPVGEYICLPDLSTLRPLPFAPGHLGVLGYLEEKTPYPDPNNDQKLTVDVKLCARSLLKRIVENAKQTLKTEFLVGIETEFILLSSTRPVVASHEHQWSSPVGILANSKEAKILHEIAFSMNQSNLSFQMYHPEAAPGQYEIVSGPLSPLDAADQVILVRELIVNVAAKHGLHATFSPRPFDGTAGSSAHVHISVHRTGDSEKPTHELSPTESSFLAGVLEHLPALPVITLPTPASYRRMLDGVWSGGTYVHYGTENREAPIRLTNATSPVSRNFEMRFVDGTANPYLAIAAILGAGLTGVKEERKLDVKDCKGPQCAFQLTEKERADLGIKKRMPLTIEEARKNLEESAVMKEVLGEEMVGAFLQVNKTLNDALVRADENQSEQLSRLVEMF